MTEWACELGSNHNGSLDRAIATARAAADAGCTAFKVQQFKVSEMFSPGALQNDPGLLHRQRWEFPLGWHEPLSAECSRLGMRYGITVFSRDPEAFERAAIYADYLKVSSYQLLDLVAVRLAAKQRLPLIISVGMATEAEVKLAVVAAAAGSDLRPTLLHCVSAYPTMAHEANLRSIAWLRETFDYFQVGWSDHSCSDMVLHRAAHFYKADHIEVHMDLDGAGWEYDGGHCWLPNDLKKVIQGPPDFKDEGYYACDGKKTKAPSVSETMEKMWRSDPMDGLRPLLAARTPCSSESAK